jgi:7-cyano-7-deazaguanine synthase
MRIVVLASGGVDSGVLLARAATTQELAGVVFCDYGQPAALQEWAAMRAILKRLGVRPPIHEVPLTTVYAGPMRMPSGEPGPRVVPGRNLLFLAHALNWAASLQPGVDEVWYGAIADDARDYFDCRPDWARGVSDLVEGHLLVRAPLVYTSKTDVIREARANDLLDLCWSCYAPTPTGQPCGSCNSCASRAGAERESSYVQS